MKWIMLIGACLSDLTVLTAIIIVLWHAPHPLTIILVCLVIRTWYKLGFCNWRPSKVREYLRNARKMGL